MDQDEKHFELEGKKEDEGKGRPFFSVVGVSGFWVVGGTGSLLKVLHHGLL